VFSREEKINDQRKVLTLKWPLIRAVLLSKALVQRDSVVTLY